MKPSSRHLAAAAALAVLCAAICISADDALPATPTHRYLKGKNDEEVAVDDVHYERVKKGSDRKPPRGPPAAAKVIQIAKPDNKGKSISAKLSKIDKATSSEETDDGAKSGEDASSESKSKEQAKSSAKKLSKDASSESKSKEAKSSAEKLSKMDDTTSEEMYDGAIDSTFPLLPGDDVSTIDSTLPVILPDDNIAFGDLLDRQRGPGAPDASAPQMSVGTSSADLGIRFNKINFRPEYAPGPEGFLPLGPEHYPISVDTGAVLSHQTYCPSVVVGSTDYECRNDDVQEIIDAITSDWGGISHPNSNPDDPYWGQLESVIDAQLIRLQNDSAPCETLMKGLPDVWEGYNIYNCSEAVHDEFPGSHHVDMMKRFLTQGMKPDYDVVPFRAKSNFLKGPVMWGALNSWSIVKVGAINFWAKYHVGMARPEEVAFKIYKGILKETDGVPSRIVDKMKNWPVTLEKAPDFTAYPEGSPQHPSWPAMHSAASSASLWLAVVANLTEAQLCQAIKLDAAVANARTVAGVHYPWDNCGGLDMGQEVVARKLLPHLVEMYGSDPDKVQAKIEKMRFKWCLHDPIKDCEERVAAEEAAAASDSTQN